MEISTSSNFIKNITGSLIDALSSNKTYELNIPSNVVSRAKLMCMYIQDEVDCAFDINDFFMLLYLDFVNYAIKNYNPDRVIKEAVRKNSSIEDDQLIIVMNSKEHVVNKSTVSYSPVYISMSKREAKKGQIILDELYDLYKIKIPFEVLLSNLLINFIEDYKNGTNKRAYTSIVKILKQALK